ncbi:MAG: HNH endonuclease [Candidatus Brocadiales bacterium]|nr:HNH endonuclease [Candidatus Brocadiales bacterium]
MSENIITSELRREVAERAYGCCEYCHSQARFAMQSFSIEHIVPRSKGGDSTDDNLALACQGCNNHKYIKVDGYDPITGEIVQLFHPRKHPWNDHFSWNDDFTFIIGITPIGRATVEELGLNREGLVNLRRILYEAGEHPPVAFDKK